MCALLECSLNSIISYFASTSCQRQPPFTSVSSRTLLWALPVIHLSASFASNFQSDFLDPSLTQTKSKFDSGMVRFVERVRRYKNGFQQAFCDRQMKKAAGLQNCYSLIKVRGWCGLKVTQLFELI